MPRYEIVDPVIRELDSETAEDAAAIFHRQLLAEARRGDSLVHLAMWRDEAEPAAAARLPTPRQSLGAFFAAVERCAGGRGNLSRSGGGDPRSGQKLMLLAGRHRVPLR
jgi:hypothetical protein